MKILATKYTESYTTNYKGRARYRIRTAPIDLDTYSTQFEITPIKPYDLQDYYWAKKDSPGSTKILRNGKLIEYFEFPDYWECEDEYADFYEYSEDLTEWVMEYLTDKNAKLSPQIDHT